MEKRQLGRSGLTVVPLCLGGNVFGWTIDEPTSHRLLDAFVEQGFNFIDTADSYSTWAPGNTGGESETIIGSWLKGRGDRDRLVIATKVGSEMGPGKKGLAPAYIRTAVEDSLRRLRTDYIDLYQLHWPDRTTARFGARGWKGGADEGATPIEETLRALDDLVRAGKVRYVGHSNRAGWQIAQAEYVARELGVERFVSAQNHYNLLDRRAELEVVPAAAEFGLGVLPYFPLANGLLTGKYSQGDAPEGSRLSHVRQHMVADADLEQLAAFGRFARERGITEVQAAIGWLAAQGPVSSVIAGATRAAQVVENAAAADWLATAEDLAELDALFPGPEKVALF